jgi:hypothetical protein
MIQSQIYRDTGMMPQMQSALDPMTQIGSTMQGFMESYNNAGRFSNKIIRDENGFVIDRVTGTEQKAAMVAEQYGLDPEMVSRLAGGGNLENWMSGIKSKQLATGGLAMADAANQAAVNGNVRGVKRWNRGMARNVREAEKHMRRAVDDQGNKLYDDEKIDEIMANAGNSAKDITASGDVSGMSDDEAENFGKFLQKQGRAEKGEDESWKDYVANNIDSKNAKLMKGQYTKQRRLEEFRNLTTEKEENREEGGGGNEVIELGPYAKQFFQMVSPGAMNKAAANAGGPATNQGYPSSRQIGPAGGYSN